MSIGGNWEGIMGDRLSRLGRNNRRGEYSENWHIVPINHSVSRD